MNQPTVSVVEPVYNGDDFLRESIDSILCQTWSDFELVLVDDGSTDESLEIIQEYANRDSRIVVLSRPNTGIVGALNDGVAKSRGEFIAIMHADDISFPQRLERQVAFLRANTDCVAVGSSILRVDEDGSPLHIEPWTCDPVEVSEELLMGRGGIAHPAAMIRVESMRAVGGYRREFEFIEDKDLWLRLDEVGDIANLPEVLFAYRRHTKTISCQNENRMRQLLVELITDAYQRRGLDRPTTLKLKPRHGDANHRELSRWVRGASKNGSFATASRYLRKLIVQYPLNARTWNAAVGYTKYFVRHSFKRVLSPQSASSQTQMLSNALSEYRNTRSAIGKFSASHR